MVADKKGMTINELMDRMSYAEFIQWLEYYDKKNSEHEPIHYYLAQIAMMCLSPWSKKKLKLNDFLIKFEKRKRIKLSKVDFSRKICAMFGVNYDEQMKKKREKQNARD